MTDSSIEALGAKAEAGTSGTNVIVYSEADSPTVLHARLGWVRLFEQTNDAGLTCRRCGISRPTLRKWVRRFQEQGEQGLRSHSRRRHTLPEPKVTSEHEAAILKLRVDRNLGPRRLQSELKRTHSLNLSTATLWKVLHRAAVKPLRKPPRRPAMPKRYSRPIPGERVQLDNCKIGKNLYQFTAIDDCTRLRVLGLYSARSAKHAVHFLTERVVKEFPFPIQRVQTDRGTEFFAYDFQNALRERKIKFRPIRPMSPHLNGKVERSQQTDRIEFWMTVDLGHLGKLEPGKSAQDLELAGKLAQWQSYYNEQRPHGALHGKTPQERLAELTSKIPAAEQVAAEYKSELEPERCIDWQIDQRLAPLLRSMAKNRVQKANELAGTTLYQVEPAGPTEPEKSAAKEAPGVKRSR